MGVRCFFLRSWCPDFGELHTRPFPEILRQPALLQRPQHTCRALGAERTETFFALEIVRVSNTAILVYDEALPRQRVIAGSRQLGFVSCGCPVSQFTIIV